MPQLSFHLSAETEILSQVLGLMEAFRAFDSNNDGKITFQELGGLMSSLGYNMNDQEIGSIMRESDNDRDGFMSVEEFLEMNTKDIELGGLMTVLKDALALLVDVDEDRDNNGSELLTGEELFEAIRENGMMGLSLDACREIVRSMDLDGDGAISFEDFKLIINSLL